MTRVIKAVLLLAGVALVLMPMAGVAAAGSTSTTVIHS